MPLCEIIPSTSMVIKAKEQFKYVEDVLCLTESYIQQTLSSLWKIDQLHLSHLDAISFKIQQTPRNYFKIYSFSVY